MYHQVVERIVRKGFQSLSQGDYRPLTALMSERCHYQFAGRHALGGLRRTRPLIAQWFERFLRVLPGFQFVPVQVLVGGWPWNTVVAVRLAVSWRRPDGALYENSALQMTTLRWFRAVDILTVDDSQALAALLQELAQRHGIAEAAAAPIEG